MWRLSHGLGFFLALPLDKVTKNVMSGSVKKMGNPRGSWRCQLCALDRVELINQVCDAYLSASCYII